MHSHINVCMHTHTHTHKYANMHTGNNNENDNDPIESGNFTITSVYLKLSPTHTVKWQGHNHVQIMCSTLSTNLEQHVLCHVA